MIKIEGTEYTILLLDVEISLDGNQIQAKILFDIDGDTKVLQINRVRGIDGREFIAVPQMGLSAYMEENGAALEDFDHAEFINPIVTSIETIDYLKKHNIDFSQIRQGETEDGSILTDLDLLRKQRKKLEKLASDAGLFFEDDSAILYTG